MQDVVKKNTDHHYLVKVRVFIRFEICTIILISYFISDKWEKHILAK